MKQVHVRTLGTPQVFVDQQRVSFRTRKVLALLIYLVVEQKPVARARLVALLWPSATPERGRMSLRSALALLRDGLASAAVDPSLVVADADLVELARDTFRWDGRELLRVACPVEVEAPGNHEARAARVAAPFLDGFTLADAPVYVESHKTTWWLATTSSTPSRRIWVSSPSQTPSRSSCCCKASKPWGKRVRSRSWVTSPSVSSTVHP